MVCMSRMLGFTSIIYQVCEGGREKNPRVIISYMLSVDLAF